MPDKLFDVVLAALQKIPHIKIKEAYRNQIPLKMYGGIIFDDAGQIIVDFDKAQRKKWEIIPWENGKPLANLEDVRKGLMREVSLPRASTEYFLIYERPAFYETRFERMYEQGRFDFVAVGTLPFFGYPDDGCAYGYFNLREFFPYDLYKGSIDSLLIDRHSEIQSHLS